MMKFKLLLLLAVLPLSMLLLSCTSGKEKPYKKSRIAMDTLVSITVYAHSEEKAEKAMDSAFKELNSLSDLLNFFSETSEVASINRSAGVSPVKVSKETFEVIEKALSVSEDTGGAFDITIGAVSSLWDFHKKTPPDPKLLKEGLKSVGYKNIVLDKEHSTVYLKKKGMKIDLGAIAKGYGADKAVAVLKNNGIRSGLVSVAGDIKTFGAKPDGSSWRIGIKNPRPQSEGDALIAVLGLGNNAVSTSGDYERFFIKDGVRYHHILDPSTGYPASECRSVSIITKEGVYTDAFSTAVFILGPERGMEVMRKIGLEGMIIDTEGNIFTTEGMKGAVELVRKH